MNRNINNSPQPAFPLERVKILAASESIRLIGKKSSRDAETYFCGIAGLLKVISQLETRDFKYCKTDGLPPGCIGADVYMICTDASFDRQKRNIHDLSLIDYYLKFWVQNDVVLLMLSNHPRQI